MTDPTSAAPTPIRKPRRSRDPNNTEIVGRRHYEAVPSKWPRLLALILPFLHAIAYLVVTKNIVAWTGFRSHHPMIRPIFFGVGGIALIALIAYVAVVWQFSKKKLGGAALAACTLTFLINGFFIFCQMMGWYGFFR